MALDGTYAGLQTSVADFLNRGDLLSVVPDFIKLAEAQLNRRLRVADMITSTVLSVSASPTPLPADFNGMISFELPAGSGGPLRYEKPDGVRAMRQTNYASAGTPIVWTIVGTGLEFAPSPSAAFSCPMVYYARIPALTGANTTNYLLTKHPDLYLYGALLQSAPYLKDDPRIQAWASLYGQAVGDAEASDGRVSFGHGLVPPVRSAAGPPGTSPMPPIIGPQPPGGP
jgi:hypothetical protein